MDHWGVKMQIWGPARMILLWYRSGVGPGITHQPQVILLHPGALHAGGQCMPVAAPTLSGELTTCSQHLALIEMIHLLSYPLSLATQGASPQPLPSSHWLSGGKGAGLNSASLLEH